MAFTPGTGTGTRFSSSGTVFTRSHTVASGAGRFLLVSFTSSFGDDPGATTATWNGTSLGSPSYTNGGSGKRIWMLTGAEAGAFDAQVNTTNAVPNAYLAVMSWTADGAITPGTPVTDAAGTTTPSVVISSATGNLVVGGFSASYGTGLNPAPGSGVNERFSSGADTTFNLHFADKPGAASVTYNYNLADFSGSQVLFAVNLVEAAGAPADTTPKPGTLGMFSRFLRAAGWF